MKISKLESDVIFQSINIGSSWVPKNIGIRLVHIPTRTVIECCDEKTERANRRKCEETLQNILSGALPTIEWNNFSEKMPPNDSTKIIIFDGSDHYVFDGYMTHVDWMKNVAISRNHKWVVYTEELMDYIRAVKSKCSATQTNDSAASRALIPNAAGISTITLWREREHGGELKVSHRLILQIYGMMSVGLCR